MVTFTGVLADLFTKLFTCLISGLILVSTFFAVGFIALWFITNGFLIDGVTLLKTFEFCNVLFKILALLLVIVAFVIVTVLLVSFKSLIKAFTCLIDFRLFSCFVIDNFDFRFRMCDSILPGVLFFTNF